MRKIALLWLVFAFVGMQALNAQVRRISGKVTSDEDGMGIPGVSVVVKGTTLGTITSSDGTYQLNVPAGSDVLVFSFVGMKTVEMPITGDIINVALVSETIAVDEVMVVAYGTATKETFTGSAASVKNEELAKRQVSNVTQSLSGKVAGVQTTSTSGQPGTEATVRIRGIGSMSASNAPLYILDGVPYDGAISAINPNDIESMSILKDAAASAIYGARGANGVIIITTKKGKTKEAVITVDGKFGTNRRGVPNYDVMTDPAMYYETFYKGLYNSKIYAGASMAEAHAFANSTLLNKDQGGLGYQVYKVPAGEYFIGTNGKLNPKATLGYKDDDYFYTPDDWYKELFDKNNLRQEYNVSISGSSDKINYYVSGGYLDDSGIVSGSGFSRFTGRSNVDYQAKEWLKVGANIDYVSLINRSPGSQTSWGSSGNLFYVSNMIAPIYPMYVRNSDGSIKVDNNGITVYDFGSTTNQVRAFMGLANPAITLKLDDYKQLMDRINSKWYAEIDLFKGMKFTTIIGASVGNSRYNYLYNPFYGGSVADEGNVYVSHARLFGLNQQYLLNYRKSFGSHSIDLLVGHESYNMKDQDISISSKKLYNPHVAEIGNAIYSPADVDSYTDKYSTQGYLGQIQYDYNKKYLLSASYRRDASSRFHPDRRWGDFGSVGAAWIIDRENFFSNLNATWVDLLKFKASYGIQGNDNLGNYYPYLDQFNVTNADGEFSVSFAYKGNKDITWETSYNFNAGFEFGLFRNAIAGSVEYFNRKTVDLLYNQPVPVSWGYSSIPTNVGSLRNQGVEADLSFTILNRDQLRWTIDVNATRYKNEILDLAESVRETGIKASTYIYEIGGSLYDAYLREYAGPDPVSGKASYYLVKDGEYELDEDGNKQTTDDWSKTTQRNIGSTLADVYGGFGTTFAAYGFDLSLSFAYQLGGEVYDFSYEELMHSGDNAGLNWHKDILDAWTPDNTDTDVPRLNAADDSYQKLSSRFLVSSDYLALNNITFGYTFPKRWTESMKIAGIRLYFMGDNMALLTARKGLDPRQSLGGRNYQDVGTHIYTALRTISSGLTITF